MRTVVFWAPFCLSNVGAYAEERSKLIRGRTRAPHLYHLTRSVGFQASKLHQRTSEFGREAVGLLQSAICSGAPSADAGITDSRRRDIESPVLRNGGLEPGSDLKKRATFSRAALPGHFEVPKGREPKTWSYAR